MFAAAVCVAAASAADAPVELESAPLAARSGPRGATLFATLSAERTGIDAFNAYDDPSMWGERFHEFNSGAIGTGVAIGDYDGDGLPDVFVVCKTQANHLFRNLGGFRFEDVAERAGVAGPAGAWKQGAAFADVNNDGRLDLYVCRFGAPNLLYMNQGDGTFRE
ncbi:MAG TPA: VCBS repeat-containing protein, partial [Opitutaceae bacterium]